MKNIDIDIDMVILENIDTDIDILKNIDIDKCILQNIDIDNISYQLEYSISNRAGCMGHTFLSPKVIHYCMQKNKQTSKQTKKQTDNQANYLFLIT